MNTSKTIRRIERRLFLKTSATAVAAGFLIQRLPAPDAPPPSAPAKPPPLPLEKIRDVVIAAHRNLAAVRALVDEIPLLVNACYDWGGGDFETPLEAAAHTGGRAIAEFLMSRNARPSLFSSAMLGQLDVIQAALAQSPDAHATPGPHGFTLLHCARQGGESAAAVRDWLIAHGAEDVKQRELPFRWS